MDSEQLAAVYGKLETYAYTAAALNTGEQQYASLQHELEKLNPAGKPEGVGIPPDPFIAGSYDALLTQYHVRPENTKLLYHPNRETRKSAYHRIGSVLPGIAGDVAGMYRNSGVVRGLHPRKQVSRTLEIPERSLDTLVDLVWSSRDAAHRLFSLKAGLLGLSRLEPWDLFAPVNETQEQAAHTWDEAAEIACTALGKIAPDLKELGRRFFTSRWIDGDIRPGKRGGAFTHPGTGTSHPYVFLNFAGSLRDTLTLVHELFHGVHYFVSGREPRPVLMETFAALGEELALEVLKGRYPGEALWLEYSRLETLMLKTLRQTALFLWELGTGGEGAGIKTAGLPALSRMWVDIQSELYGPAARIEDDYALFWITVPHFFHYPLYGLNYVIGSLYALSIQTLLDKESPGAGEGVFVLMEGRSAPWGKKDILPAVEKGLKMLRERIETLDKRMSRP